MEIMFCSIKVAKQSLYPNVGTFMKLRKWANFLTPLLMIIGSTLLTYLVFEFLIFGSFLSSLPLKTHEYLNKRIRPLAQSSKKSVIPRNYVALVGDSYAQGYGDWFLDSNFNENPPFHSAHVINQRTGIDIISFGKGGASSVRGMVTLPIAHYEYINATPQFELARPGGIIVYFYEGNDLNDNITLIERHFQKHFDMDRIYDREYFREFIDYTINKEHPLRRMESSMKIKDYLPFANFSYHLLKSVLPAEPPAKQRSAKKVTAPPNIIQLLDGEVEIPRGLQSPALGLKEAELTLAIYVFEQSLRYLREYFKDVPIGVVYIPSPLSCYEIASREVSIQTYQNEEVIYDGQLVRTRSNAICYRLKEVADQQGVTFVDAREYLWPVAQEEIIHGPRDWKHFNKKGYTILAEAVIALLDRMK